MNWMLIVLESMRYDVFKGTPTPNMDRIGKTVKAHSGSDWTLPSVMSMMTGMLPHSELGQPLREEFIKNGLLAEGMWIPSIFSGKMRYNTIAHVSIPWLGLIDHGWTTFTMSKKYCNMGQIVNEIELKAPFFCYLHIGDTHMPYGEKVITKQKMDEYNSGKDIFSKEDMKHMIACQKNMLRIVDRSIGNLMERVPEGTRVIITSDHGEFFGENHLFGHGVGFHEKVFEVPMIMGDL